MRIIRAGFFLLYVVIFAISGYLGEDLRYLSYVYAVLIIIFLILIRSGVLVLDRFFASWLIFYSLMFFITTAINFQALKTGYFYNQLFLLLLPPIFAGVLFSRISPEEPKKIRDLEIFFVRSIFVAAFIRIIPSLHKFDLDNIDILNSTSPLESGLSHLMGLIFVFCLIRARKFEMLMSFLLMVLFTKRIAIAATILVIIVFIIGSLFKEKWQWKTTVIMIMIGNLLYIFLIYDIMYGNILNKIFRAMTGLSINQFTLGRFNLYKDLTEMITPTSIIFGNGTGQVNIFLRQFKIYEHIGFNPHSDFLRLFLEYGLLFTILWFGKIYLSQVTQKDYKLLMVPLYLNILMFTDNVILYHYIMIPFFIIIYFNYKRQQFIKND